MSENTLPAADGPRFASPECEKAFEELEAITAILRGQGLTIHRNVEWLLKDPAGFAEAWASHAFDELVLIHDGTNDVRANYDNYRPLRWQVTFVNKFAEDGHPVRERLEALLGSAGIEASC